MKWLCVIFIATIAWGGCKKNDTDPDQSISYKYYSITDPATDSLVFSVSIPSAFTPNMDGINEYWAPIYHGLDSSDYYISIVDKTGYQVFESRIPGYFDGVGPNQMVIAAQTLTYYIETKDKHYGEQHAFTGTFVIIR